MKPGPKPIHFTPDMDRALITGRGRYSPTRIASDIGVSLTVLYRRMRELGLPVRASVCLPGGEDFSFRPRHICAIKGEGRHSGNCVGPLADEPLWKAQPAMQHIPHPKCGVQPVVADAP